MVIYDSDDSDLLIQSLSENLKSATAILDRIHQGTQHLNSVIDSGALSGAAYRAGQRLFQTYISPMIQKLASKLSFLYFIVFLLTQWIFHSYLSSDVSLSLFQKIISGALSGIWLVSGPIFGITVIIRGRKIMEQRKEENINE